MKKIVPFTKDLMFKTKIGEITSIALDNTLKLDIQNVSGQDSVEGKNFVEASNEQGEEQEVVKPSARINEESEEEKVVRNNRVHNISQPEQSRELYEVVEGTSKNIVNNWNKLWITLAGCAGILLVFGAIAGLIG